jgi:prevent-host-death family protein
MIAEGSNMKVITSGKAEQELEKLLDEAAVSHEPIQITSASASGVLLSEEDWRSIQETLYLLSVPGMRESIRVGLSTPIDECSTEPGW